jgi:hypothetical protein
MRLEDAEKAIHDEWRALPATERSSDTDVLIFAIHMARKYGLRIRCSGDKQQRIFGWAKRWQAIERRLD